MATVLAAVLATATVSGGDVVLNEVMYNPAGDEQYDEFVEVFNTSETEAVDLAGWKIGEPKELDPIVSTGQGLVLQPRQFGLILDPGYVVNHLSHSYDPLPWRALLLTTGDTDIGGGFSNSTPDTVMLQNPAGAMVASYVYSGKGADGHSDEKIDPLAGDGKTNWGISLSSTGTPGAANTLSADAVTVEAPSDSIAQGREVVVQIVARNVQDLYSANLDLKYDSKVVQLISVADGPLLGSDARAVSSQTVSTDSTVNVGITRLGQVGGVSGSGTVVSMTFLGTGGDKVSTSLRLANVKLRDSGLSLIPLTVKDGRLSIYAVRILRLSPSAGAENIITTAPLRVFLSRLPAGGVNDSTIVLTRGASEMGGDLAAAQQTGVVTFSARDTLTGGVSHTAKVSGSLGLKGGDSTWVFATSIAGDIFDIDDPLDARTDDDYAGDGLVDGDDLAIVGYYYQAKVGNAVWSPLPDIKRDGTIDVNDLALLGRNYGRRSGSGAGKPFLAQQTATETDEAAEAASASDAGPAAAAVPSFELVYSREDIQAGEDLPVMVIGNGVSDLFAAEYALAYSENDLIFDTVEKGSLMGRSGQFGLVRRIKDGRLYIGLTRFGNQSGVAGTGPLATVHFRARRSMSDPSVVLADVSAVSSRLSHIEVQMSSEAEPDSGEHLADPNAPLANYPNPFNLGTVVDYSLPTDGWVHLEVYDMAGHRVAVLDSGRRSRGPHRIVWDGRSGSGGYVASGVYLSRLSVNGKSWCRKMVLVR